MRNNVCSNAFSQRCRSFRSICFYIKQRQAKREWGVSGREVERKREMRIKRMRDRAYERIRNGMGWEMTVGKDTCVSQIHRTNKTSIKEDINILGGSVLLDHCAVTFVSFNLASHHTPFEAVAGSLCTSTGSLFPSSASPHSLFSKTSNSNIDAPIIVPSAWAPFTNRLGSG